MAASSFYQSALEVSFQIWVIGQKLPEDFSRDIRYDRFSSAVISEIKVRQVYILVAGFVVPNQDSWISPCLFFQITILVKIPPGYFRFIGFSSGTLQVQSLIDRGQMLLEKWIGIRCTIGVRWVIRVKGGWCGWAEGGTGWDVGLTYGLTAAEEGFAVVGCAFGAAGGHEGRRVGRIQHFAEAGEELGSGGVCLWGVGGQHGIAVIVAGAHRQGVYHAGLNRLQAAARPGLATQVERRHGLAIPLPVVAALRISGGRWAGTVHKSDTI